VKDFLAGAALGVLLGLLVGLSASEVVAGVVTGLVGLLGTMLGLRSEQAAGFLPGGNAARVGGFAAAMAVALVFGVIARTHGWLQPSPAERAAEWVAAGMSQQDAAALVAFERTGLLPPDRSAGAAAASTAATGALFSGESLAACDSLLSRNYATAMAFESALQAEGGDWAALVTRAPSGLEDAARRAWLQQAVEAACAAR
jgi:xanthosine utilization system XapX-like protein